MGAVTGLSVGSMLCGDSSRFVIPALAGLGGGTLGYALAKTLATNSTPEKYKESIVNQLVTNNNKAIIASNKLNKALSVVPDVGVYTTLSMDPNIENRARFASLPFDKPQDIDSRGTIYDNIKLDKSSHPITNRVKHVEKINKRYHNEEEKIESITDDLINKTKQYGFKYIGKTAHKNREFIKTQNTFYRHPTKTFADWISCIKNLPEYTTETTQTSLSGQEAKLKQQERDIKQELAYLASLLKNNWSNLNLSSNVWSYI